MSPEQITLMKNEIPDQEVTVVKEDSFETLSHPPFISVAKSSLASAERTAEEFLRLAYSGEISPPSIKGEVSRRSASTGG